MKETKLMFLALVALLALGAMTMVACGGDDDDDDDSSGDDDSGGSGDVQSACVAYVESCLPGADSASICDPYDNVAAGGECYVTAVMNYFDCQAADCTSADCATTYQADLEACGA